MKIKLSIAYLLVLIFNYLPAQNLQQAKKNPLIKPEEIKSENNVINNLQSTLPDRTKAIPASIDLWKPLPQFQIKKDTMKHWYALEKENDSIYWKNVIIDKIIVCLKKGISENEIKYLIDKYSLQKTKEKSMFPEIMNFYAYKIPNSSKTKILNIIKEAKKNTSIECAEPDIIIKSQSCTPNDPYWSSQWGPYIIWADSAWCYVTGAGTWEMVGIIDNACDYYHTDLYNTVWYGYDFADLDNDPTPINNTVNHGTHVSGISSGEINNGIGISGMTYDTTYFAKAVGDADIYFNSTAVINALNFFSTIARIRVINMSFGSTAPNSAEETACDNAWNSGKLLIAASGNDGTSPVLYPAGYSSVMAVGSIDQNYNLSSFSNYGSDQEVTAPGGDASGGAGDIYSTLPSNNYGYMAGTSMASPMVTGLAGLMFATNPTLTNYDARTILQQSVFDFGATGWDQYYGYGVICAYCAVEDACNNLSIAISANGSINFCQGSYVTLTAPVYSNGITYQWLFNGNNITNATANIYNANQTGYYTCDITTLGNCTAISNSINVLVTPTPSIAATPTGTISLCQNPANTNYTTTGASNATSYAWNISPSGAGTLSGTGTTANVNWNNTYTGSATIYVYGVNSCGIGNLSNGLNVTINPLPTQPIITANGSLLTSTSASTYQWYYNGSLITGATSQTYIASQNGLYSVMITNTNSCSNTSALFSYNVTTTLPFVPELYATAGDYFINGNVALEWSIGECLIETKTGTNFTLTQGFHQSAYVITLINEIDSYDYSINVYPNPATDNITIDISSRTDDNFKFKLLDVRGRLIINEKIKSGEKTITLNIQNYSKGIYMLNIYDEHSKLIKSYKIEKIN